MVGYFDFKTTRSIWPQEAKSQIVEVSTASSSFIDSHQNIIIYYINVYTFLVIAHRYIKHVRICMQSVMVLVHVSEFDVYE